MDRVGEWWFGADMMDLFRHLAVGLGAKDQDEAAEAMRKMYLPMMDDLQGVLDKSRMASEVHMVFKFRR